MSDKEKNILETVSKILPKMTEAEKEKLLAFGEGMAFMIKKQAEQQLSA